MVDLRRAALLSLAVASASAHFTQGQTTLRYKYKEGDVLTYKAEQNTKTKIDALGKKIEVTENMAVEMTWKIIKVNEKGDAEVTVEFAAVKIAMDAPAGKVAVSSTDASKPDSALGQKLYMAVKLLSKLQLTGKQSATGELTNVKISEESQAELKKLTAESPDGQMFDPDALKNLIGGALGLVLPTEAIAKGKIWMHTTSLKVDVANADVTLKYTYQGTENGLENVALTSTMEIKPIANSPIEFRLKAAEGKGSAKFDNQVGRLRELNMIQHIEMEAEMAGKFLKMTMTKETKAKLWK